jgi:hypothetical protein
MGAIELLFPLGAPEPQLAIAMDKWITQVKFVGHACLPLK